MDERNAIPAFAALSQETRLRIVRLLVRAGPPGMAAGAIAKAMKASASVVSFHLKELEHAGLTTARREGRTIVHSADAATLTALITFLMKDCCADNPDICTPAIERMRKLPGKQRRCR
jgi:ArsR family transcriptional regulator